MENVSSLETYLNGEIKLVMTTKHGENVEIPPAKQGSWPVAIFSKSGDNYDQAFAYPIFDGSAHCNLYGRLMTIVEAVIEDRTRQKAVKDLISKELGAFGDELRRSAAEIANGGGSSENIYTRN